VVRWKKKGGGAVMEGKWGGRRRDVLY